MVPLKIHWKQAAINALKDINTWNRLHVSRNVAEKLIRSIVKASKLLLTNLALGIIEQEIAVSDKCYRSVIVRRSYKVVYYVENDTIYNC